MRKIYPIGIKTARENANYTQELLSDHSGVSVRTLQNVESNRGCKIDTLKDIAAVLNIEFTEFLPKPNSDTYKGSWYRVIFDCVWLLIPKSLLYSAVATLALVGFVSLVHFEYEANPLTQSEIESREANFEKMLNNRPENAKPIFKTPEPKINYSSIDEYLEAEKIELKSLSNEIISAAVITFIGIYLLFAGFFLLYMGSYSRDFNLLVLRPLSNKFSSVFQSLYIKVKQSSQ